MQDDDDDLYGKIAREARLRDVRRSRLWVALLVLALGSALMFVGVARLAVVDWRIGGVVLILSSGAVAWAIRHLVLLVFGRRP